MRLLASENLSLLLGALPLLLLFVWQLKARRRRLARLFSGEMRQELALEQRADWLAMLVWLLALAALVGALARPVQEKAKVTVERQGRDVVFMVDVSRSMLAEDLHPNRLERAKLAINDCVAKLNGDRVGLVAFAGSAKVICPLTLDYSFFAQTLAQLEPGLTVRGGTLIGDALRTVMERVFDQQLMAYKDVILITDGEDHESFPVQAAEVAGDEGVRLIVIGLGNERQGQPIPLKGEGGKRQFLRHEGKEVMTRLDGATLRAMARATPGGRYLPVATGTIDLGEVYLDLIAGDAKRQLTEESIELYDEKFQYLLALALLLLAGLFLWGREAR
ncbi:MAG: VWA domain-containing protein [Thermodesulfobacteriota bacterium]